MVCYFFMKSMTNLLQAYFAYHTLAYAKNYENFQDETSSGSVAKGRIDSLDDAKKFLKMCKY